MIRFNKNIYSKTYNDQNIDQNKFINQNNYQRTTKSTFNDLFNYQLNQTNQLNYNSRILKENNYQIGQLRKNFKLINKSNRFKLILKNSTKLNNIYVYKSTKNSIKSKFNKLNQYKKVYKTKLINVPKTNLNLQKNPIVQQIRKNAVKSSINRLNNKKTNKNKIKLTTINTKYCMFFCRFGKCNKIDTCPYKHDKDKIRICNGFIKGKCEVNGCLLSHKIETDKMPVCSFFLKGICNLDNCQYRHVNVSENAEICKDFVNGFCGKGDQCKLLHKFQSSKFKTNQIKNFDKLKKKKSEFILAKKDNLIDSNENLVSSKEDNLVNSKNDVLITLNSSDSLNNDFELIDICSDSNSSNMEISDDDDICLPDNNCLDFIPLVKECSNDSNNKSTTSPLPESQNEELYTERDYDHNNNYDSDSSWFSDDGNGKNEFIHYIPQFLLN